MDKVCEVSCLIPFYNEGERLFSVLETVTQVEDIAKIVCIDDGSEDDNYRIIQERWPQISVVRQENQGKTGAIKRGLAEVDSEYVLMMDADLQNIQLDELQRIVAAVRQGCDADMVIFRRLYAEWFVKMNRGDVLLSGERIIRREDLTEILKEPVEGFQLEVAINEYMQQHRKRVRWVPWSATNTYKMDKRGPLEGFWKDFQMYADILLYVGLKSYFRQVATFARKPLRLRSRQPFYKRFRNAYQTSSTGRTVTG
ncbi:glycosyltransferase family 2 protein [Tellurirhabdus rosea]|uniref:glycosyltransferase family 2 protein n=1 Tax=Tellurirhabdus rosea TaxID=2674997 RepID=UPI0022583E88|nr:glycosyltransferase family 2 protein [Tellurirhabdus rosea]